MHWTYEELMNVPADIYDVLLDELVKETKATQT
jgi:hypothetical protein